MAGFAAGSPTATDPLLVEALIDLLHDRGFTNVAVVSSADSSALWAANRDVYALSDLLGYRFVTPKGRDYEIIDLGDAPDDDVFPTTSALHGCGLSRAWLDADIRIVFTKNRTDETNGYALCLDTLISVLPLIDKDLHYRRRRHPGDVVAALLSIAPVQFCLTDAVISAHGMAGQRAPTPISTDTIIAAHHPVLADYIGALRMGLDPSISPLFERVHRTHPLPRRYTVSGSLAPYADWTNVPIPLLRTRQMRSKAETLDRLVTPWLQQIDTELFPLQQPLDARLNAMFASTFAESHWLAILVNAVISTIGEALASYRVMFDKDALHREAVSLGIDTSAIPAGAFDDLVDELLRLEPVAEGAPDASDTLRWRYVGQAVVFRYTKLLPINYEQFVRKVDIARTIQFMNDYLGGMVVPLLHDNDQRPIRQAERNIYLPQPNYIVLYQGKPIDVSKLEVVEYTDTHQRLYWKTIASENASATYDDGIATFARDSDGTRVTIMGRQQFALPLFFQVFDLDLVPDLKAALVTHAYQTFFDRTLANFEALVEGRDIRIGKPTDEPSPLPIEQLMPLLQKIGEIAMPLVQKIMQTSQPAVTGPQHRVDSDGFTHITPVAPAQQTLAEPDRWLAEIGRFLEGFRLAAQRDLLQSSNAA
jgi:uncharacterized protein (DUF362 family)